MSYLELTEAAAPATPAAGKGTHYLSTAGEARLVADSGADLNLTNNQKLNLVRNSGFWFAQRGFSLLTFSSVGGRAITLDGWGVSNENASMQTQRVDTIAAPETGLTSKYYGAFTKITSNGKLVLCQCIESSDIASARGTTVRVQILAKGIGAASATWRLGLVQLTSTGTADTIPSGAGLFLTAFGANTVDPTLGANLAYIAPKSTVTPDNGTIRGNAVDITVTSAAWQRFGACFDVPTTAKNLIVMLWSDSQVTTTQGTNLSQVSLTIGQEIQEWAPLSVQQELVRCFRYYQKSFNIDTTPAQSAGTSGVSRGAVSVAGATANQPIGVRFYPPMRVAPTTTTFYNPSAVNAFVRNTTAGSDATATASANVADDGMDILFTGIAAWTVAQAAAIHWSAEAEL